MATAKLKRRKLQIIVQVPAELTKAEGKKFPSEIHTRINSIWNKEELPEKWKKSINLRVFKKGA
jgi:hypothetical protein